LARNAVERSVLRPTLSLFSLNGQSKVAKLRGSRDKISKKDR